MLPVRFQSIAELDPAALTLHRGIEKEGLRVTPEGRVAADAHPLALGSALTHPTITTDYSEALLEFVTPVFDEPEAALSTLQAVHQYTARHLGDQVIWAGSMPCRIDKEEEVRIAEYGTSNVGRLKHVYRHGLWHRYGRKMQCIAGLHYNLSFGPEVLQVLAETEGKSLDQKGQNEQYFHLIRNFRRHQYLLAHLFGASPAYDQSFDVGNAGSLPAHGTRSRLLPSATSLRMSDIGYTNPVQGQYYVCFNGLHSFVKTIDKAMRCSHAPYEAIGIKDGDQWKQLNTHVLQIENEYYSDIRPKRVARSGERPSHALLERGVEYVEVRCLDLNPFQPLGIDAQQMRFLDLFLLWCLVKKSPRLSKSSCETIRLNQLKTTQYGAQASMALDRYDTVSTIREWGLETLERMTPLAECLERSSPGTLASLHYQRARLRGEEETVAQRVTRTLLETGEDHIDFVHRLSAAHKKTLLETPMEAPAHAGLAAEASASLQRQRDVEASDTMDFESYVARWMEI